uniref:Uncharacterized protein n=1 Tax=Triticum urartu TaxID=4572 RepID=A0A8R7QQ49_TRIUA
MRGAAAATSMRMRRAATAPLFFAARRPAASARSFASYSRAVQRRPEDEFEAQWSFQHTMSGEAAVLTCLICSPYLRSIRRQMHTRRRHGGSDPEAPSLLPSGCISPWPEERK